MVERNNGERRGKAGLCADEAGAYSCRRADPDFLDIAADRCVKARLAIRGFLPALVCYNVFCLWEWASYLGPESWMKGS